MLGAIAAVDALAIQGCFVPCLVSLISLKSAPGWLTAEVRLTPAGLHGLSKAVVTAGPGGVADFVVVLAAPAFHLAVRAVAFILCVPFKGPIVQLLGKKQETRQLKEA